MKLVLFILISLNLFSQVEKPDNKYLFQSDSPAFQKAEKKKMNKVFESKTQEDGMDFNAGNLKFDKEKSELIGTNGVVASGNGIQIQADSGKVNSETKDSKFKGNVSVNYEAGKIVADEVDFNLDSEKGSFKDAELEFDSGDYLIKSEELKKTGDNTFDFGESIFSTCHCPDGDLPWNLSCGNSKAEIPGLATAKSVTLNFKGVPIFYTPYLFYPVNIDRQSGLLTPKIGYGNQDGFETELPYFITTSRSSDILLSPFIKTNTRLGSGLEYRQVFSKTSNLRGKIIYSDETPRDGDLRGTNVENLFDKVADENRFAGYLQQYWSASSTYLTSDIHYVSDDLFLREFNDQPLIGAMSDNTTTSKVRFGFSPTSFWNSNIDVVYNQNINTQSDDLIFHRVPQWRNNFSKKFKPFKNPYGIKLKTSLLNNNTMFTRKVGYEGTRSLFVPKLEVPFFYKAYLDGNVALSFDQAFYSLNNETIPDPNSTQNVSDNSRGVSKFEYKMGTALEKVYKTNSFFRALSGKTFYSENEDVSAVKHIMEPSIKYLYSPKVDQSKIPLFDTSDVVNNYNLVVYGLSNSWVGKIDGGESEFSEFLPQDLFSNSINNLSQGLSSLPLFSNSSSFRTKELMGFEIKQGYLFNPDPTQNQFTNIDSSLTLSPERGFGFKVDTSYDQEDSQLKAWGVGAHLRTLRGDLFRIRNVFQKEDNTNPDSITQAISQIEGSLEIPIAAQVRLAGYGRYDERENEFFERKFAVRFSGKCNCWYMDLGYKDMINPNQEQFIFGLTLKGLGDLTQSISTIRDNKKE